MAFLYSLDDDAGGAFTVDPNTGTLTVASPSYVGVGQAFRITWRAVDTTGAQPPFSRTELIGVTAGAPKLGALSLLTLSATAGSLFTSAINGQTAGSTVTAVSSDGTALVISGGVVSGTFSGAGAPTITLTETLAGAIGSPFASTASVAVAAAPIIVPVLSPLTLSIASATAGTAFSATISGQTTGSTITATSSDGTVLTVSGSTVSGTFGAAGTPTISLVETLAGATGSPRTSTASVTVSAVVVQPTLAALSLSSTAATAGSAFSATITGKINGSTVQATSSDGTGLTVSGATVSGTFAGAGTPTITLVETLSGATGSPRTSTAQITVAAAPVTPANSNVDFSSAANSGFLAAIGA